MTRLRILVVGVFGTAAVLAAGVASAASDQIQPGSLSTRSTFEHIGVVWEVSGDTDLDSTMIIEFRESGETSWKDGAPAVRAYPSIIVNGDPLGFDSWGASAMFLLPGTNYEIRATLTDPDGGSETRTVTASTRRRPTPDSSGATRYVVPGDGGGSGTSGDPFRGLQAAADAAASGDTFMVSSGTYGPFELTTSGTGGSPITFLGDGAVIEGAGTDRGIVTLGRFDEILSDVIVDGFTIRDGTWGIDAQNTQDIVISNNVIEDVDRGIVNRRDNAWESNQTICDNTIQGRTVWPASGIPPDRGIDLRGDGNVVCFNLVRYFGDCISLQPTSGESYGNDVYGNDVAFCVDDGIEIDYNQANVRVWRNRITNARMGVSVQPIYGGPAYIFRNEMFNLESEPIKMHNETTGFIVAHNSGAKNGNGYSDAGSMWRNATLRNNVFLGTEYAFEFVTVRDEGFRDFDYNAWGTSRGTPYFKWENVRYDRIGDLPSGVEDNGIEIGFGDLANATLPADWNVAATIGDADLRATGSQLDDRGEVLPNLNDPFVFDGAPDIGAFEAGQPMPSYGPGAAVTGPFTDVPANHFFVEEITWLANEGITAGCNSFGDRFCPDDSVSRAQMASFLVRAFDLPASSVNRFSDDSGSVHEANIDALAQAGITTGCTASEFCPNDPVSRAQMASFIVRAMGLSNGLGADLFTDDDGSVHEDNIDRLATAGITLGCSAGRFCPSDPVIRAHMAAFLFRALSEG